MSHAVVMVALDATVESGEIVEAVEHEMAPFDENGEWFRDGSRWDWWEIGGRWPDYFGKGFATVRLHDFDFAAFRALMETRARAWWMEAENESAEMRKYTWGIEPGATLESYVASRTVDFPTPPAFLRNRRWNESTRMGWWGATAATECERSGKVEQTVKCRTKVGDDATIVTWNEEKAKWQSKFRDRFVAPLDPRSWLVAVDYHV